MPKYSADFGNEFDSLLNKVSRSEQYPAKNKSDTIRRAVALYTYLHDQLAERPGCKVAIVDANNQVVLLIDPLP